MYAPISNIDVSADVMQRDSQTCLSQSHLVFPLQRVAFRPGKDSNRHTNIVGKTFIFVTIASVMQVNASKKNINRFSSTVDSFL